MKPPTSSLIFQIDREWKFKEILLVDGYYKSIPAPWHKEILLALEKGIKVTGISSLGAVRANELKDFGILALAGYMISSKKMNLWMIQWLL